MLTFVDYYKSHWQLKLSEQEDICWVEKKYWSLRNLSNPATSNTSFNNNNNYCHNHHHPELFIFQGKIHWSTIINCQSTVTRTESFTHQEELINSKLRSHTHADHILSQCINLLGLVHTLTILFSSLDFSCMLHFILVRSKL